MQREVRETTYLIDHVCIWALNFNWVRRSTGVGLQGTGPMFGDESRMWLPFRKDSAMRLVHLQIFVPFVLLVCQCITLTLAIEHNKGLPIITTSPILKFDFRQPMLLQRALTRNVRGKQNLYYQ